MPLAQLEERIEQELGTNPVLELRDPNDQQTDMIADAVEPNEGIDARDNYSEAEQDLVVRENNDADDFDRLEKISDYLDNEDERIGASSHRMQSQSSYDGERDKKMDALANTAARTTNLIEHLLEQWNLIDASPAVKRGGELIISAITPDGYLRVELESLLEDSIKHPVTISEMTEALNLVQQLEPAGVGARDVRECLLIQIDALKEDSEDSDRDFDLERALVADHLEDLKKNHFPQISRKLNRSIEELKAAVKRLGRLHPHPGKQIGIDEAPPVTPDAIIYRDEETGKYEIRMTHDPVQGLYIRGTYKKMLKDKTVDAKGERKVDKKTRDFVAENMRNARWLLESIEQRRSTIQRVIRQVVDAQTEFLDKGPEYLRPLPMIDVADRLGIHVATVSRAVSEKWIQTPRGVFPLRRFFSGGTKSSEGEDMSWDAVKEKIKMIVDEENKDTPLNDDEIVDKLNEQGIVLARRTVAKYRGILNLPTARQRREFK